MRGPFSFGQRSQREFDSLDYRLRQVLESAIQIVDFSIICGHRNKSGQTDAFNKGVSKLPWPRSKHNTQPSKAVDIAPYPIDWTNNSLVRARWYHLMGIIYAISRNYGTDLRFGLDWNSNLIFTDQNFHDLPHIELR